MDVSFLLSADELFTLMSLSTSRTGSGQLFADEALAGAGLDDLSGLVDKKLARRFGEELELMPVVRMISDALSRAEGIERSGETWNVRSPWVSLRCERYLYNEGLWKITPVMEDVTI